MTSKDGYRPTDIRDARKMGLVPSVTTVLQLLDKPMLTQWKVRHAIEVALAYPQAIATTPEFIKGIVKAADEEVNEAAEFGTLVHAGISDRLNGKAPFIGQLQVKAVVDGFWEWYESVGFTCTASEQTFVNQWAGTADWQGLFNGKPAIADFKTQNGETEKDLLTYDEHALQLAGYAEGLRLPTDTQRLSIIISRTNPGVVKLHVWKDNEKWSLRWWKLWDLWKCLKDWQ